MMNFEKILLPISLLFDSKPEELVVDRGSEQSDCEGIFPGTGKDRGISGRTVSMPIRQVRFNLV
jgi:hypothetical protein